VAGPTVAELNVEINAKSDGLKASVREVKGELDGLGKAAESSAKRGGDAFSKLGEGIEKRTAGVRKFAGALSSVAGVVTGLIGVFALLTAGVRSAIASQEAYTKTIDSSTSALEEQVRIQRILDAGYTKTKQSQIDVAKQSADAANEINDALREQIGLLSTIVEDPTNAFTGTAGLLRYFGVKSNTELTEQAESAIRKVNAAAKEVASEAEKNARLEAEALLEAQTEAVRISFLNETDKIREAAKVRKEELKRAAIEAGLEAEDVTLQAALESINRRRDADIAAIEEARKIKEQADAEALKKKEQQEIESAQRAARAAREAFRSELEGVTEAIFGSGGNSFTTRLDTLVRGVSALRSEIRGLK